MRIIAPYTSLHPATNAWLQQHAPNAERYDLTGDEHAYYRLLADLWASGDDFTLIEHDMEPPDNTLQGFDTCTNGWCIHPYPGSQPIWTGKHQPPPMAPLIFRCALGCTRFRHQFTAANPHAITHMNQRHPQALTGWQRLDSQLASYLHQHGHTACEHQPMATHHHPYET